MPSPLKILASGAFLSTNGRHVQTPPTRSPIPIGTNIFDVESDSNDGCPFESLMGVVGHNTITFTHNHNGRNGSPY